jgi:hypothetical protein
LYCNHPYNYNGVRKFEEYRSFKNLKNTIMLNNEKHVSVRGTVILLLVLINTLILKVAFTENEGLYIALVITLPLLFIAAKKNRITNL